VEGECLRKTCRNSPAGQTGQGTQRPQPSEYQPTVRSNIKPQRSCLAYSQTVKMVATYSAETLSDVQQTRWRYNSAEAVSTTQYADTPRFLGRYLALTKTPCRHVGARRSTQGPSSSPSIPHNVLQRESCSERTQLCGRAHYSPFGGRDRVKRPQREAGY
jgi:hypothetical protein